MSFVLLHDSTALREQQRVAIMRKPFCISSVSKSSVQPFSFARKPSKVDAKMGNHLWTIERNGECESWDDQTDFRRPTATTGKRDQGFDHFLRGRDWFTCHSFRGSSPCLRYVRGQTSRPRRSRVPLLCHRKRE